PRRCRQATLARQAGARSARARSPLLPRHDEAAIARLGAPGPVRPRPARHHRVVSGERVVVEAHQGGRSAVQGVLQDAVREQTVNTILVTGAAGFAGSHVVEALAGNGTTPLGWTHRAAPPSEIVSLAEWESVDLLDLEAVRAAIARARPSAVVHCAGAPCRVIVPGSATVYAASAAPLT